MRPSILLGSFLILIAAIFLIVYAGGGPGFGLMTFTTNTPDAIEMELMNETAFIVAFCDETNDVRGWTAVISNQSRTGTKNTTVVGGSTGTCDSEGEVAVSALNGTEFVFAWYDNTNDDVYYKIFNINGKNLTGNHRVSNNSFAAAVDVAAFNKTHFMIVWRGINLNWYQFFNYNSNYTNASNLGASEYGESTAIAAFNKTQVAYVYEDDVEEDVSILFFDINKIGKLYAAQDIISSSSDWIVDVAVLNNTAAVATYQLSGSELGRAVFKSNRTIFCSATIDNVNTFSGKSVSAINRTTFVIGYQDAADSDASFRIERSNCSWGESAGIFDVDTSTTSTGAAVIATNRILDSSFCKSNKTRDYFAFSWAEPIGNITFRTTDNGVWNGTCPDWGLHGAATTNVPVNLTSGWFGYQTSNLTRNGQAVYDNWQTILSDGYQLVEFNFSSQKLSNTTWWSKVILNLTNVSTDANMRVGLNVYLNFTYSNTTLRSNLINKMNATFKDLKQIDYAGTIAYISLQSDPDQNNAAATYNALAQEIVASYQTNNLFPVYCRNNCTGIDTAYINPTPFVYISNNTLNKYLKQEIFTLRNNVTKNRIYSMKNSTVRDKTTEIHNKIFSPMRDDIKSPNLTGHLYTASLDNGDLIIINPDAVNVQFNLTITNITRALKDYWDSTNDRLVALNKNTTINVTVSAYSGVILYKDDFDKISLDSAATGTLYKAATSSIKQLNYTDKAQNGNYALTGAQRAKIELYDPTFTSVNPLLLYYGWINSSQVDIPNWATRVKASGKNPVVILADTNNEELDTLCAVANLSIYGYISVADYNTSNPSGWYTKKTNNVTAWVGKNESISIFIDGNDAAVVADNNTGKFTEYIYNLSQFVRYNKNVSVILNTYTYMDQICHFGGSGNATPYAEGGCMKESTIGRWNGTSATSPTSYNYENWATIDEPKARWYELHGVTRYCTIFFNMSLASRNFTSFNYTKYYDAYLGSQVLGCDYWYISTPDFQFAREFFMPNLGTNLQNQWYNLSRAEYRRSFSNGLVRYNTSSRKGYFDNDDSLNRLTFYFDTYGNAGDKVNVSINGVIYNFTNSQEATETWYSLNLTDAARAADGYYSLIVWSTNGINLYNDQYTDTRHSWYSANSGATWTAYTDRNWMIWVQTNTSASVSLDSVNAISQSFTTKSNVRKNMTVTSSNRYELPVWSYGRNYTVTRWLNSTFNGIKLNFTTNLNCLSSNPTFTSNTIGGLVIKACKYGYTENTSYQKFVFPSLSGRSILMGGNNSKPVFTQDPPDRNWYVNVASNLDVNCTDPDGDRVYYYDNTSRWEINEDTGLITYTPTTITSDTVKINCTDEFGASNVTVIKFSYLNTAPSFNTRAIAPTTAYKNTALNVTFNVTDINTADANLNITEICWFTNNRKNATYCFSNTSFKKVTKNLKYNNASQGVPINKVVKGQTWIAQINVSDGRNRTVMNTTGLAISNLAPTINRVNITPTTRIYSRIHALNVTFNVTDPDAIDNLNVTACWFTNKRKNASFCYTFANSPYYNIVKNARYNNASLGIPINKIQSAQNWTVQINVSDGTSQTRQNSTQSNTVLSSCTCPTLTDQWRINETCTVQSLKCTIKNNFIMYSGANVTFKNVTLIVNSTSNGQYGLTVNNGSRLMIKDLDNNHTTWGDASNVSAFTAATTYKYYFKVLKGTTFNMTNSEVTYAGWANTVNQRGLEINASRAKVINSTFRKGTWTGITVYSDNVLVADVHMQNLSGVSFYGLGSKNLTIRNVSIGNSAGGISLRGVNVTSITYSSFWSQSNPGAIVTQNVAGVWNNQINISYNTFSNANTYMAFTGSNVIGATFKGNLIQNTQRGFYHAGGRTGTPITGRGNYYNNIFTGISTTTNGMIDIRNINNTRIFNNTFYNNPGPYGAVYMKAVAFANITNITVYDGLNGITTLWNNNNNISNSNFYNLSGNCVHINGGVEEYYYNIKCTNIGNHAIALRSSVAQGVHNMTFKNWTITNASRASTKGSTISIRSGFGNNNTFERIRSNNTPYGVLANVTASNIYFKNCSFTGNGKNSVNISGGTTGTFKFWSSNYTNFSIKVRGQDLSFYHTNFFNGTKIKMVTNATTQNFNYWGNCTSWGSQDVDKNGFCDDIFNSSGTGSKYVTDNCPFSAPSAWLYKARGYANETKIGGTTCQLINNSPPVITKINITPQISYSGKMMNVSFNITDGNASDVLNVTAIKWFTNGALNGSWWTRHTAAKYIDTSIGAGDDVYAAKMDNDTDIDVIISDYGNDVVSLYTNDGAQGFTKTNIGTSIDQCHYAIAGDIDGDTDMDVVTVSYNGDDLLWLNHTTGTTYVQKTIDGSIDGAMEPKIVDLDDDGDMDIVLAAYEAGDVVWYANNGAESFTKSTISNNLDQAHSIQVRDFDGDGDKDIVALGTSSNTLQWYNNNGAETFTIKNISRDLSGPKKVASGDMDKDGDFDLAVASADDDRIYWYRNNGTGNFTRILVDSSASNPQGIFMMDLNNDTEMDIVQAAFDANAIYYYYNNGAESFTKKALTGTISAPHGVYAGDLSGDGINDTIAIGWGVTSGTLAWYRQTGLRSSSGYGLNGTTTPFLNVTKNKLYNNNSGGLPVGVVVKNQVWIAEVTISDGKITTKQNTSSVKIQNSAPTINSKVITPATAYRNNALNLSFSVNDVDPQDMLNVTLKWSSYRSLAGSHTWNTTFGVNKTTTPFNNITRNTTYNNNSGGVLINKVVQSQYWRAELTAYDGNTTFGANSTGNRWITNRLPTFNQTVGQINISHNVNLALQINVSDLDGDNITFSDNTSLFAISTVSRNKGTIADNPTQAEANKYRINISTNDLFNTTKTTAFTYVIYNHFPNVSRVNISPQPAHTNSLLRCKGTYADFESDAESGTRYRWFKNNVEILNYSSTGVTLGARNFTNGNVIKCEYMPKDGLYFGPKMNSSGLTIQAGAIPTIDELAPTSGWQGVNILHMNTSDWDGNGTVVTAYYKLRSPLNTTISANPHKDPTNDYAWEIGYNFPYAGNWTILLNATDSTGLKGNRTYNFFVNANYYWDEAYNLTTDVFGANNTLYASIISPANLTFANLTILAPNGSKILNRSRMNVGAMAWDTAFGSYRINMNSSKFINTQNGTYNFYIEMNNTYRKTANVTGSFSVRDKWIWTPRTQIYSVNASTDVIRFNFTLIPGTSQTFRYNISVTDFVNKSNYTFSYKNAYSNRTVFNASNASAIYSTFVLTPSSAIRNGTYRFNISISRTTAGFTRTELIPIQINVNPPAGILQMNNGDSGVICNRYDGTCDTTFVYAATTTQTVTYDLSNVGGYVLTDCSATADSTLSTSGGYSLTPATTFNVAAGATQEIVLVLAKATTDGVYTGNINVNCLSSNPANDDTQLLNDQRPFITLVSYTPVSPGGGPGGGGGGGPPPPAKEVSVVRNITPAWLPKDGNCNLGAGENFGNSIDDCSKDLICDAEHGESYFNSEDCSINADVLFFGCFKKDQPCLWKQSYVLQFLVLGLVAGGFLLFFKEEEKKKKQTDKKERMWQRFKRNKFFNKK